MKNNNYLSSSLKSSTYSTQSKKDSQALINTLNVVKNRQ